MLLEQILMWKCLRVYLLNFRGFLSSWLSSAIPKMADLKVKCYNWLKSKTPEYVTLLFFSIPIVYKNVVYWFLNQLLCQRVGLILGPFYLIVSIVYQEVVVTVVEPPMTVHLKKQVVVVWLVALYFVWL